MALSEVIFGQFDANGDGALNQKEFASLCYAKGYALSEEELSNAMRELDTNGDGTVSLQEFQQWWKTDERFQKLSLPPESQEQLRRTIHYFKFFDQDESGSIDSGEFHHLHKDLVKNGLCTTSLSDAFAALDRNKDGAITLNEYVNWLVDIGSLVVREKSAQQKEVDTLTLAAVEQKKKNAKLLQDAINYFQYFDRDGSGGISREEFKLLHADLVKNQMTELSLKECFKVLDKDGDKDIAFTEYVAWLSQKGVLQAPGHEMDAFLAQQKAQLRST
eukprot:NODE_1244_length_1012_cov_242.978193_g956_i0.p1 GENE.NODE_1244_length_1012_cov_242.978193_g956_i0~~NODE_1244_length_1012_cov_242.978193_g956_i0.p1  ORF type:complete len:294 (+),score=82.88 NODE_1244_length_1012_cov_242.978193_g956_i0:59-883(+)